MRVVFQVIFVAVVILAFCFWGLVTIMSESKDRDE